MVLKEAPHQPLPSVGTQQGEKNRKALFDKAIHIVEKQITVDVQAALFNAIRSGPGFRVA